jgi:hypothetical protein
MVLYHIHAELTSLKHHLRVGAAKDGLNLLHNLGLSEFGFVS